MRVQNSHGKEQLKMIYIQQPKSSTLISNVFLAAPIAPDEVVESRNGHRELLVIRFDAEKFVIHFIDGKEFRPAVGSVCIIPPRITFFITGKDMSQLTCIKCLGSLADTMLNACGISKPSISVHPQSTEAFVKLQTYMNADIKSVENLNRAASAFYELVIETVFAIERTPERKPIIIAQKIKQFIDDNLQEEISVSSIARAFYLSETHVIRIFRDKYAETPKQYILRKKIETAKKMLLETPLQIKEIAMMLHFADSYHFSHTFKRYTKYSPEKFRMHENQIQKK